MKVVCLLITLLMLSLPHIPVFAEKEYSSKDFNLYDESRDRIIPTTVYYPTKGENLPVIIVSHGGGGNRTSLITHVLHLVKNGYVVIVPEHIGSNEDYLKNLMEKGYTFWQALKELAGNTTEWENRPKDISFIIDMAHVWNRSDEDLKGKMDLSKIGILGHSYGAYTVMAVLGALVKMPYGITNFEDKRVKVGIAISPQGTGGNPKIDRVNNYFFDGSWKNITKPISFFAESDDLVQWRMEPFNEISGDVYFIRFIATKHTDFADWKDTLRSKETRGVSKALALRFFDIYLKGDDESPYSEEYADSLCSKNKIVTDTVWRDKVNFAYIERPLEGYLYVFGKMVMPIRNTLIIGKIAVEAKAYRNVSKIEFYIDNLLKFTDSEYPYEWTWNEIAFFNHEIKVVAYDERGNVSEDKLNVMIFNL